MRTVFQERDRCAPIPTSKNFLAVVASALLGVSASAVLAETAAPQAIASELVSAEPIGALSFDVLLVAASGASRSAVVMLDGAAAPITGRVVTLLAPDIVSLMLSGDLASDLGSALLTLTQSGGEVGLFVGDDPLERHLLLIGAQSDGASVAQTLFTPTSNEDGWVNQMVNWINNLFGEADEEKSGGGGDVW